MELNINNLSPELLALLALLTAFAITYFSIPAIIRLSLVKRLYDTPNERKLHSSRISSLGGVGIFGGMILAFVFFSAPMVNPALNSVLVALIILFITGVKDDLYPLTPVKKLLGQLLAIGVIVFQGNIRLDSFYGLYGVWDMPYVISAALTILFFLLIINSFNFIDGINGLGAGISTVVAVTYALWFYYLNEDLFLILALSMAGAQVAFLRYNLFNAKIFMGDTGSMINGFLAGLLTIYYLQANERFDQPTLLHVDALVFALATLAIPLADTIRVVIYRLVVLRKSPFHADRNHIHHKLLDLGLSHSTATLLLVGINIALVGLTYLLNPHIRASVLMVILVAVVFGLSQIPNALLKLRHQATNP
jgi:UDP-N-acetylmuramyl pentapeptide phosphotransferase/UDP-N-acetylglucosamine-1-phosphate transferase